MHKLWHTQNPLGTQTIDEIDRQTDRQTDGILTWSHLLFFALGSPVAAVAAVAAAVALLATVTCCTKGLVLV
jgi:hypothetical protein